MSIYQKITHFTKKILYNHIININSIGDYMEKFLELINIFEFQTFLKIMLGGLLAGLIGLERSSLNKPAGFGTHALLGISGVLVVVCSQYMNLYYDIDMARIPAQLLSGIGFIGAGTIMRNGYNVKGVTTAAGLLAVTCIGLTIGAGYYIGGIIATILVYLVLSYAHNISDNFERYSILSLEITIKEQESETINNINKYFSQKKIELKRLQRTEYDDKENKKETIEITCCYDSRYLKKNKIIEDLFVIENIVEVTEL